MKPVFILSILVPSLSNYYSLDGKCSQKGHALKAWPQVAILRRGINFKGEGPIYSRIL